MDDYTNDEQTLVHALGRQIAAERVAKGMTQEQLAGVVGIAKKSLTRYENGERDPQLWVIAKVAEALGIVPSQLIIRAEARRDEDRAAREKAR